MTGSAPEPRHDFRWPVTAARTVAARRDEVWNIISSPGMLPLYHPFCEANPVQHWPGPVSADEIRYFSGWVLQRRVTGWFDGVGFDAEVGRPGGGTSAVSWRVAEVAERRTRITVTIYPHVLQHLPVVVRWLPHLVALQPKLPSYLDSVLRASSGSSRCSSRSSAISSGPTRGSHRRRSANDGVRPNTDPGIAATVGWFHAHGANDD